MPILHLFTADFVRIYVVVIVILVFEASILSRRLSVIHDGELFRRCDEHYSARPLPQRQNEKKRSERRKHRALAVYMA